MRVCVCALVCVRCAYVCVYVGMCVRACIPVRAWSLYFAALEHSDQVDEELGNIEVEEVIKVDRETLVTEYIVSYWLLVEALKIVLTDNTASGLVNGRNEVVQLHCLC